MQTYGMSDVVGAPVIILNWNGWEDTFACLRSLREHGDGCPVWLVDNASSDDRRALRQKNRSPVRGRNARQNAGRGRVRPLR